MRSVESAFVTFDKSNKTPASPEQVDKEKERDNI